MLSNGARCEDPTCIQCNGPDALRPEIGAATQTAQKTTVGDALEQGIDWILSGGNYAGLEAKMGDISVEVIIKRKGFAPPGGTLEELSKDRIYTHEGFHCALKRLGVTEIDGPPMAFMEFPVDIETMVGLGVTTERHIQRWAYVTLKGVSTLPDPVARVELLTDLFKTIKNATATLKGTCDPMIVWRQTPTFSSNPDQGYTTLFCRLYIPGVNMDGIRWVEGV